MSAFHVDKFFYSKSNAFDCKLHKRAPERIKTNLLNLKERLSVNNSH